jgi:hypothetical protein
MRRDTGGIGGGPEGLAANVYAVVYVISSLGVGFIMELIRVFATTIRWSISIPKDVYNGPASTSFQKP